MTTIGAGGGEIRHFEILEGMVSQEVAGRGTSV